ncbi:MAG: hypothetical protein LBF16_01005 [Pseudomonadales bacterium]|nr:hypothetical protein [Pseudomonadales bacterium]
MQKRGAVALMMVLALSACQSGNKRMVYHPQEPEEVAPPPAVAALDESELRRQRRLADLLYAAKRAYDDNRLMTPAGNNAYDTYADVLRLDPDNAVALQGLDEIALRYIALADEARNKGQYDQASALLDRSARLGAQRTELRDARERLAQARKNPVEFHALDPAQLSAQSPALVSELERIARDLLRRDATFLINARNDVEGRWIYKVMHDAVGGERLHGNIGINGTPGILIALNAASPTPANPPDTAPPTTLTPAERAAQQTQPRVLEQHPARAARPAAQ